MEIATLSLRSRRQACFAELDHSGDGPRIGVASPRGSESVFSCSYRLLSTSFEQVTTDDVGRRAAARPARDPERAHDARGSDRAERCFGIAQALRYRRAFIFKLSGCELPLFFQRAVGAVRE